ncbi:hypothetical protein [Lentibacillus saliphilus]|uniref:hypothetical protein n=1 Tax=Lentibacillus saliphilus TaxID=2737028 RepID=UPI001C3118AA|nr:hypothetical protein [Lentibacillus saliphilus]
MNIQRLPDQRIEKTVSVKQQLHAGKIVQGKVVQLYPGNRATVQIGSQQLHAQLKAALTRGERYHFQVEQTDGTLLLRVMGKSLGRHVYSNILSLLNELGLDVSKQRVRFVASLVNEQIPFTKHELLSAFKVIEAASNQHQLYPTLKYMMLARLPLKQSVLEAVHAKQTSGFAKEIQALGQTLGQFKEHNVLQQALLERLSWLMNKDVHTPNGIVRQIMIEQSEGNQHIFRQLQAAGVVDSSVSFSKWQTAWKQYMTLNRIELPLLQNVITQAQKPFLFNETEAAQTLNRLQIETNAATNVRHLFEQLNLSLKQAVLNEVPLANGAFKQLQSDVNRLMPFLTEKQQHYIQQHTNNNIASLQTLHRYLDNTLHAPVQHNNTSLPLQQQFLSHLYTILGTVGLSHEYGILSDPTDAEASVKSLLIQLVHHQDKVIGDRFLPLLHFINGLQIDTVQETPYMLQATLQLPGEKIGLSEDAYMQFSGRKRKNGTIDPDDCTILFQLNLANLQETLIDMHIQKRTVALTIWSTEMIPANLIDPLKPALKNGLAGLDYQLTGITFKQLNDDKKRANSNQDLRENHLSPMYEGVDIKI